MEKLYFSTPKALIRAKNEEMLEKWKEGLCKFCNVLEDGLAGLGKLTDDKMAKFFEEVEDNVYEYEACTKYKLDPILAFCQYDLMEVVESTKDYMTDRMIEDEEGKNYVKSTTLKKTYDETRNFIKAISYTA